eukprot:TRINITY_DN39388_c0_g1_i1.p1 TRINITY_DN39388_c0_g1~~TRINITY_DN39388_c0_g1_i1.p1  ORF type:complete len:1092 (+),score=366.90 TRINITY_DN39388_c0_g1_i1:155-3430(+)
MAAKAPPPGLFLESNRADALLEDGIRYTVDALLSVRGRLGRGPDGLGITTQAVPEEAPRPREERPRRGGAMAIGPVTEIVANVDAEVLYQCKGEMRRIERETGAHIKEKAGLRGYSVMVTGTKDIVLRALPLVEALLFGDQAAGSDALAAGAAGGRWQDDAPRGSTRGDGERPGVPKGPPPPTSYVPQHVPPQPPYTEPWERPPEPKGPPPPVPGGLEDRGSDGGRGRLVPAETPLPEDRNTAASWHERPPEPSQPPPPVPLFARGAAAAQPVEAESDAGKIPGRWRSRMAAAPDMPPPPVPDLLVDQSQQPPEDSSPPAPAAAKKDDNEWPEWCDVEEDMAAAEARAAQEAEEQDEDEAWAESYEATAPPPAPAKAAPSRFGEAPTMAPPPPPPPPVYEDWEDDNDDAIWAADPAQALSAQKVTVASTPVVEAASSSSTTAAASSADKLVEEEADNDAEDDDDLPVEDTNGAAKKRKKKSKSEKKKEKAAQEPPPPPPKALAKKKEEEPMDRLAHRTAFSGLEASSEEELEALPTKKEQAEAASKASKKAAKAAKAAAENAAAEKPVKAAPQEKAAPAVVPKGPPPLPENPVPTVVPKGPPPGIAAHVVPKGPPPGISAVAEAPRPEPTPVVVPKQAPPPVVLREAPSSRPPPPPVQEPPRAPIEENLPSAASIVAKHQTAAPAAAKKAASSKVKEAATPKAVVAPKVVSKQAADQRDAAAVNPLPRENFFANLEPLIKEREGGVEVADRWAEAEARAKKAAKAKASVQKATAASSSSKASKAKGAPSSAASSAGLFWDTPKAVPLASIMQEEEERQFPPPPPLPSKAPPAPAKAPPAKATPPAPAKAVPAPQAAKASAPGAAASGYPKAAAEAAPAPANIYGATKDISTLGTRGVFAALDDSDEESPSLASAGKIGKKASAAKAKAAKAAPVAAKAKAAMNPLPRSKAQAPMRNITAQIFEITGESAASGRKWGVAGLERPVEKVIPASQLAYEEEMDPELACYLWDRRSDAPRGGPRRSGASAPTQGPPPATFGPALTAARATPPNAQRQRQLLGKVMEMGFDEQSARRALVQSGWSGVEDALGVLLG